MPKRSSKKKNIRDVNVLAAHIVEQSTGEPIQRGLQRAMGIVQGGRRDGATRLEMFVRRFGDKVPESRSLLAMLGRS